MKLSKMAIMKSEEKIIKTEGDEGYEFKKKSEGNLDRHRELSENRSGKQSKGTKDCLLN